jgi:hypothetical protein
VSHILFLKLRKIWASQKQLMHSLRKKDVAHLEVNIPLATNIDDTMINDHHTKSLKNQTYERPSSSITSMEDAKSFFEYILYMSTSN